MIIPINYSYIYHKASCGSRGVNDHIWRNPTVNCQVFYWSHFIAIDERSAYNKPSSKSPQMDGIQTVPEW